ncbi:transporter substrate-binding domain-containing protein [Rhodospirillaceae bacterium KN72]|uniref:Transporter substrate-binding domain-containing protein n=1 Tax=Pacificispira spongiicola TaxID=2729598 RepID=A0A7Y0HE78_9PROT|nr:transporter substrate-binding domain-containing protein [Pacificispira spongiicola]NMM44420.1 transporter substrate-binding domain-containing protein [Pacificispira spongiicola]
MVVSGLALPPSTHAGPPELRFAVIDWAPFSIIERSRISGINIDIATLIAQDLGATLVEVRCTFIRCLKEMKAGRLDLMASIAFNMERSSYMDYAPTPYDKVSVVFHVRAGQEDRLQDYDDLHDLQVGYVTASHYFEPFNSDLSIRKTPVGEERQLLPMLLGGRIDTYIGTNPNAAYDIKRLGYKDRIVPAPYQPGADVPLYFAFSKKSAWVDKVDALNQSIMDHLADGMIDDIRNRYR